MTDRMSVHGLSDRVTEVSVLPDTDLIIRAEQALLGAVMSDPAGQAAVLEFVRPDDMLRPYHGQVLAAMQRLEARGVAPAPVPVRAELIADPDLPGHVARDGVLLANLLAATPRIAHAPAYAGMVIERGIRQQVHLAASRIIQAAETGEPETTLQMTAQARQDIQACQARWHKLPEPMRRALPEPASPRAGPAPDAIWHLRAASQEITWARQHTSVGTPQDLRASLESIARHIGSQARNETEPQSPEGRRWRAAAETVAGQFLRDLAAGPGQVAAITPWLRPAHFARPAHGQAYALIRDMHAAGQPADPVTIAWEAARRGIPIGVADLRGGIAPFAIASAREVHRLGLLTRITRAARAVQTATSDPRLLPSRLLHAADDRLARLEQEPVHPGFRQQRSDRTRQPSVRPVIPLPDPGGRAQTQHNGRGLTRQDGPVAEPA